MIYVIVIIASSSLYKLYNYIINLDHLKITTVNNKTNSCFFSDYNQKNLSITAIGIEILVMNSD